MELLGYLFEGRGAQRKQMGKLAAAGRLLSNGFHDRNLVGDSKVAGRFKKGRVLFSHFSDAYSLPRVAFHW